MTFAHEAVSPGNLWSIWTWDPLVLVGLSTAAVLYARGARRLRSTGRGRALPARRIWSFYGALLLLAAALVSPLDAFAETIFSAHMAQHLVLILMVAPLLVYGAPVTTITVSLPVPARRMFRRAERSRPVRGAAKVVMAPLTVLGIHMVVVWLWHLPTLYKGALENRWVHVAEHGTFLLTALALWMLVLGDVRGRRRADHGTALGVVFFNLLQSGALGVILVFATTVLYPMHAAGAEMWGLTSLEDQQLAGAIMWVPAGITYFATMAVLFLRWMHHLNARGSNSESGPQAAHFSHGNAGIDG